MKTRNQNIAFPLHFDASKRTARAEYAAHVRDLVEQVLLTMPGERVNRPEFGTPIAQYVFEPTGKQEAGWLESTVKAALMHWLQDAIALRSLTVEADDATVLIQLSYVVLALDEQHDEVIQVRAP